MPGRRKAISPTNDPTPQLQVKLAAGSKPAALSWQRQGAVLQVHGSEPRVLPARTHFTVRNAGLLVELEIAEKSFRVARHARSTALQIIALCRLDASALPPVLDPPSSKTPSPVTRAGLVWACAGRDPIAWLPLKQLAEGNSNVLGAWKKPWWLLLTADEIVLVAISDAGDRARRELTRQDLKNDGGAWRIGEMTASFAAPSSEVQDVLDACALTGPGRRVHLALAAWLRDRTKHRVWVLDQLQRAATSTDEPSFPETAARDAALLCLALWPEAPDLHGHTPAPPTDPDHLGNLWQQWQLSPDDAENLFRHLPSHAEWGPCTLAASERFTQLPEQAELKPAHVALRLAHGERLQRFGEVEQARRVLADIASRLPEPTLADVDLPTGLVRSPWHDVRRQYARSKLALAQAPEERERAAREALTWAPLDERALQDLRDAAQSGSLAARVETVQRISGEPGFAVTKAQVPLPTHATLPEGDIPALVHPLLQREERLLFRMGRLAAKTQRPDFATLRLYCERVTESDSVVARVTDEAATLLGLGHVDVFVSRGHDDVGLRSFASDTQVLLVGGQHLDERSRYFMNPGELSFSIAAELSHLRLGHPRLSALDVTRGVVDKGRQALDITLSLLPVVAGLKLADRLGMITAKLSLPQVSRVASAVREVSSTLNPPKDAQRSDLGQANELLLQASRFAQLSADRAGLVAAGDLLAAIRAILLSRTDYIRVATRLPNLSLRAAIEQQRATSPAAFDDLLLRVGSLVDFYLSDTYLQLARKTGRQLVET